MSLILKKVLYSSVILLALDSIYLKMISKMFNEMIKNIQGTRIFGRGSAAVFCYAFIILGINYFILVPEKGVLDAAILGLVTYGIFETTNGFIFKNWELIPSVIDTTWGAILFGVTTYFTYRLIGVRDLWKKV